MGSKTIPNKNFSELRGRSLIEISANAAKAITNEWFISSESSKVQSFCASRDYPYLHRPSELAGDLSLDLDYLRYHVDAHFKHLTDSDWLVLLRPTSPLRTTDGIARFKDLLMSKEGSEVSSVRSVIVAPISPYKMWFQREGFLDAFPATQDIGISEPFNSPRQLLPPVYWQTGTYDAYRIGNIRSGFLSGKKILAFHAQHDEVDIDDYPDLKQAEDACKKAQSRWV